MIGVLEGMVAALAKGEGWDGRKRMEEMLERAKRELDVRELLREVDDEVVASEDGVAEAVERVLGRWEGDVEEVFGKV